VGGRRGGAGASGKREAASGAVAAAASGRGGVGASGERRPRRDPILAGQKLKFESPPKIRAQIGGPLELFFSLKLSKFRMGACLEGPLELLLEQYHFKTYLLRPNTILGIIQNANEPVWAVECTIYLVPKTCDLSDLAITV